MGVWNKVNKFAHKVSSGANRLFNKGTVGGVKLFGKGSVGSKILSTTSKGLDEVSKITGDLANSSVLAGNPLASGLAGVSLTAGLASDLTKQKNYSGSTGQVAGNALEKAKAVKDSASKIQFV